MVTVVLSPRALVAPQPEQTPPDPSRPGDGRFEEVFSAAQPVPQPQPAEGNPERGVGKPPEEAEAGPRTEDADAGPAAVEQPIVQPDLPLQWRTELAFLLAPPDNAAQGAPEVPLFSQAEPVVLLLAEPGSLVSVPETAPTEKASVPPVPVPPSAPQGAPATLPVTGLAVPAGESIPEAEGVPEDRATGLFILAEKPVLLLQTAVLRPGVPAYFAARQAAEGEVPPDADIPPIPVPTTTLKDQPSGKPTPISLFDGEGASLEPPELPLSVEGRQTSMQAPLHAIPTDARQTGTTPAPAQPATPAALPPQVPAQIAAAVAARSERPLELRLAPEELGGLSLNLRQDGDILRIVVRADQPETLDLLRRNGDLLIEELRLAGFAGASLSFSEGGGAQYRQPPPQTRGGFGTDTPPPLQEIPVSNQSTATRGLDLRL